MLKTATAAPANGHATSKPSIAPVPKASDIRDCLQLLSDALLEAVDQRASQRGALLSQEMAALGQNLTVHCDQAVQKVAQSVGQQEQTLTAAREQWLRKGTESSAQLTDLAARMTRGASQLDQVQDKLTAGLTTRGEQLTALEGRFDGFGRDMESCLTELTGRAEAQEVLTATQIAAISGEVSTAQSQLAGLVNKQQHQGQQLAELQAAFHAWEAAQNRHVWADRLRWLMAGAASGWDRLCHTIQAALIRLARRKPSPQV